MGTLFDVSDPPAPEVTTALAAAPAAPVLASQADIVHLESYGYKPEAVARWEQKKAQAVLRKCRAEDRAAVRRAEAAAKQIDLKNDDAPSRGQPSTLERVVAADIVSESLSGSPDDIHLALTYTIHVCTDKELRRLAGYLVKLWKTEEVARVYSGVRASACGDPGTGCDDHRGQREAGGDQAHDDYDPY